MKLDLLNFSIITLLIPVAIWAIGCDGQSETFSTGTYHYEGYDLEDQNVTEGEIIITVYDALIEGQKNIQMVMHVENILDAGEGLIEGRIDENGAGVKKYTCQEGEKSIIPDDDTVIFDLLPQGMRSS
jgi:hypothetical protein